MSIFKPKNTINPKASGTATSGSTLTLPTSVAGSNTSQFYLLTVSGLTFKPSTIVLIRNSSGTTDETVYTSQSTDGYQNSVRVNTGNISTAQGDTTGATIWNLKGDVSPLTVTSSGFTLPVYNSNASYTWNAYA